jgi:hypothetical protein
MAENRQGGQLRIAAGLDREGHVADVPSSGMGSAIASIASEFDKVGAKIGALADHAAAVEGAEAGKIAGLDPEFRPTKSMTIRGEAFDNAGLQVYETRTRQSMLADLDAVYDEHGNNPTALAAALSEKRNAWLSQVDPSIRPDLELSFDGAALTLNRQAARAHIARIAAEQKGAMTLELGETMKRASQQAYALGLDAEADKAVAGTLETLRRTLSRTDTTGKLLVEPTAAAKILMDAKTEIATARIKGAFSRLPGLPAKAEMINKLRADFTDGKGVAAEYDAAGFETVISSLEADYRSARAAEAVGVRALKEDITAAVGVLEKGFDPGEDAIAGLKGRLAGVAGAEGGAELAQDLAQAESLLAFQKGARTSTPAELEAWAAAERKALEGGDADAFRVQRLSTGEKLLKTMNAELKQDPLGWADRVGLVKVAPLDFSSADAAGATMKARLAQAEEIAAVYGQKPVYLRPDEKRALSVAAAQGGEQMLAITSAIAAAAGDRTPKVIAEIADQAPVVAFIAGHVALAGPTAAARDAADGIALAKTEGFKSLAPSKENARLALDPVIGRALSELPQAETAAIAAANAIYEVRARRQGVIDFDAELWSAGLNEVLGQRKIDGTTWGGIVYQTDAWFGGDSNAIVLPPAVRADGLEDLLGAITTEDLVASRPRYADGSTAPVSEVRRAKLKNAGDGRYWLALGDPEGEDPQWLLDTDGRKWVLDLNAMLPELGRRRPDLVLSGGR